MVVHAFNSSTWEAQRQVDLSEFKASLGYRASSRTARTTQRKKPCLKTTLPQKRVTQNNTWEAKAGGSPNFEASLVYKENKDNSRISRAIERDPVSKQINKTKNEVLERWLSG